MKPPPPRCGTAVLRVVERYEGAVFNVAILVPGVLATRVMQSGRVQTKLEGQLMA